MSGIRIFYFNMGSSTTSYLWMGAHTTLSMNSPVFSRFKFDTILSSGWIIFILLDYIPCHRDFIFQQHPRFLREPKVRSLVPQDAFFHTNLLELNNRSFLVFELPFLNPSKPMICIIPCLCTADIGFPRQNFISCSLFPCSNFKCEKSHFPTHKSFVGCST
jgi:hypothetical protein